MARFFVFFALILSTSILQAADSIREERQSKAMEEALRLGKAVWLDVAGTKFLTLQTEADNKTVKGGVILLHELGGSPDAGLIGVLRQGLSTNGWETLALQLPMLAADARADEAAALIPLAVPRLDAAIEHFAKRKFKHLAIIGQGLGARMALLYLANNKKPAVKALIVLGLDFEQGDETGPAAIKKIKLPILDLFAQHSPSADPEGRRERRQMGRYAGNNDYQQSEIMGAVTGFPGQEQLVLLRLKGWLSRKLPNSYPDHYKKLGKQGSP